MSDKEFSNRIHYLALYGHFLTYNFSFK